MRCHIFTDLRHYTSNLFCKTNCYWGSRSVECSVPIHASQREYFRGHSHYVRTGVGPNLHWNWYMHSWIGVPFFNEARGEQIRLGVIHSAESATFWRIRAAMDKTKVRRRQVHEFDDGNLTQGAEEALALSIVKLRRLVQHNAGRILARTLRVLSNHPLCEFVSLAFFEMGVSVIARVSRYRV